MTALTEASIPAVLADRAEKQPDDIAYTFVDYEADPAGVTDLGAPLAAPAIANALFTVTGQRFRSLPIMGNG